ncbi:MAG: TetR/AcrR family transcriptional regulator [Actinobacteria bacterium]|nr:TetR/AcrR family transcriptional regulator [Actinomycetota bacterium]
MVTAAPRRRTQAERRARTRSALLEAAARAFSRDGYSAVKLDRIAAEAGYTRGALYHLFRNKEELALAVVAWVEETWWVEVGRFLRDNDDPAAALIATARAHAVYCRRDIARVHMVLSIEFSGQDHPVGKTIDEVARRLVTESARVITAGRRRGSIPPGASPSVVALAYMGAIEGVVINLAGRAPFDEVLAEQAARGVLGLPLAASKRRTN